MVLLPSEEGSPAQARSAATPLVTYVYDKNAAHKDTIGTPHESREVLCAHRAFNGALSAKLLWGTPSYDVSMQRKAPRRHQRLTPCAESSAVEQYCEAIF